jgi:hypothetical protein
MSHYIKPTIKLPVDPANIIRIDRGRPSLSFQAEMADCEIYIVSHGAFSSFVRVVTIGSEEAFTIALMKPVDQNGNS